MTMGDRRETFERVLQPERGRTALLVVDMQGGFLGPGEAEVQRVTLDIIARAYARVVSSKTVADQIEAW